MKPLIRIKSSYASGTAKTLFDVYDVDDDPTRTIAKGGFSVSSASSAEQGELEVLRAALSSISSLGSFSEIEIQSDSQNVRHFLDGRNKTSTHPTIRSAILTLIGSANLTVNTLPEDCSLSFTSVTYIL